jgi:hypothetical protein
MYLGDENNQLSVPRCLHVINSEIDSVVDGMLAFCFNHLDAPSNLLFDDFETTCMQTMDEYFFSRRKSNNNNNNNSRRMSSNNPDDFAHPPGGAISPQASSNDSVTLLIHECRREFFSSAQYQLMERDLAGANCLTNKHVERVLQRLLDLPLHYYFDCAQLIVNHLDAIYPGDWRQQFPFSKKLLSQCPVAGKNSAGNKVRVRINLIVCLLISYIEEAAAICR